ncbi:MAG TPA: AAA family ATPase [Streptosporangiaceae bacterium]
MLVGRDAERPGITALLEAARGSSGGALVIHGVAGSGKSALLAGRGVHRNRASVTLATAAPDHTAWMPPPCRKNSMNEASMQYEQTARPVSGAPAARRRPSGTTDIAARRHARSRSKKLAA